MFSLMYKRKVLVKGTSYDEVRRKAFLKNKFSGQSLKICKKVITESGVDLGWDEIASIRVVI